MDVDSTPARGTFALRIVACADRVRVGQEVRIAGEGTIGRDPSCTIPLNDTAKSCSKIRQLSVAFLFAETIRRISDGESVTSLFSEQNNNF